MSNLEGYEASQGASRRIQFNQTPQPEYFELVQVTHKGTSQLDAWTEEKLISVHRTEVGAYKAGLKTGYIVRPLKVAD